VKQLFYLGFWFIGARFFGRKKPLQTVIFITNCCNLSCKHCLVYEHDSPIDKTMKQIRGELEYSYKQGSRFVDFEGGEPTLWKDGDKTVNDLIVLAKQIGFYSCTVTTNAWNPFNDIHADSIWVSMDGVGDVHDNIRGKGSFERLEKNIAQSGHPAVSVNMVINSQNYNDITNAIKYVKTSPHIQSISLNFHTPYAGTEHLFLDWGKRSQVVDEIIRMKKGGYSIMNSKSGLKLMKHNNFKKQCWVTNFILTDGTRLDECTGKSAGVCDQCGYGMASEMKSVFSFKPDTLLAGLNLRVKKK
jgi:MoaA/NifB/PqqE/SkfB family radical SAM enzyme